MAVLRLTLNEGIDPRSGNPINAVQRRALELLRRDEDDMSDVELMQRMPDRYNYLTFCIDLLGRLPSEVQMTEREWTEVCAWALVRQAQQEMIREFYTPPGG